MGSQPCRDIQRPFSRNSSPCGGQNKSDKRFATSSCDNPKGKPRTRSMVEFYRSRVGDSEENEGTDPPTINKNIITGLTDRLQCLSKRFIPVPGSRTFYSAEITGHVPTIIKLSPSQPRKPTSVGHTIRAIHWLWPSSFDVVHGSASAVTRVRVDSGGDDMRYDADPKRTMETFLTTQGDGRHGHKSFSGRAAKDL